MIGHFRTLRPGTSHATRPTHSAFDSSNNSPESIHEIVTIYNACGGDKELAAWRSSYRMNNTLDSNMEMTYTFSLPSHPAQCCDLGECTSAKEEDHCCSVRVSIQWAANSGRCGCRWRCISNTGKAFVNGGAPDSMARDPDPEPMLISKYRVSPGT